jgi:hypothetical protein
MSRSDSALPVVISRVVPWKLFLWKNTKAGRLKEAQLRQLLRLQTREAVDGFLKAHEVWLNYTKEDLERERVALRRLGFGS